MKNPFSAFNTLFEGYYEKFSFTLALGIAKACTNFLALPHLFFKWATELLNSINM